MSETFLQHRENSSRVPPSEDVGKSANHSASRRGYASESRSSERLGRLLSQKKGPDRAMMAVLSIALVLGLVGLALHFVWVIAIIVMALGLGFAVANSRRNRIDVVNQRAEQLGSTWSESMHGATKQEY